MSADSPDTSSWARTIKLVVKNLEKTKERVQERFLDVDERLEKLETSFKNLQQRVISLSSDGDKESLNSKLFARLEELESKVVELEKKVNAPIPAAGSSAPKPSPSPAMPASSTPSPGAPAPKTPKPGSASSVPSAPKPSVPKPEGDKPSVPSAPSPAPSAPMPSTPTAGAPAPTANTAAKQSAGTATGGAKKGEKEQLLEALKQLEGI